MEAGMEQASDGVWTPLIHAIPSVAAAIGLSMVLLWLWSLRLRDVSIVDPWWAPGFALGAAVTAIQGLGPGLGVYLAQRIVELARRQARHYC
jgi:steroid 5-alpha reductase family enzyme